MFTGSADRVVNLITFYATEVREILASIGARGRWTRSSAAPIC